MKNSNYKKLEEPGFFLNVEVSTRVPFRRVEGEGPFFFYFFLMSSALSGRRKDVNTVTWLPSVALAVSVLLRERSRAMDAMQLLHGDYHH